MNVEFSVKDPQLVSPVSTASQAVIASVQAPQGPVGMAETVLMEDSYNNSKDGYPEGQDPALPPTCTIQISVSKDAGMQIKMVDSATKKVIREIPPEELQHVMAELRRMSGQLFNKRA
jgi:FlaG protein